MAAKKKAKAASVKRGSYFKVEGGKVSFSRKYCPRCGPGIILADHPDRAACGKCGYTEFKKPA
ncbi:MAG: 30S ribosomal protein S27ae [Methanoregulaceae archaeon PtaU1.Bin059]|jgi:small subunit ribosomal protein S27Ae|nr:MAG: 30S ribosomal protein S27ae [Methanoregulaceae archaeon PtaB.Bin009]OPY40319.1 MAG: 30S ribosomal protein S27ae [Methanoregulaceae archaeon PtaU1.Bin059]HNQ30436.1 30S ribosomal protein S27ae [Methanolinea sp.]